MKTTIRRWGNDAAIRIPAALMQQVNLRIGQEVDIRVEGGGIVLAPVRQPRDLASLVDGITADNLHGEVDVGPAVGREAW